MEPSYRVNTDRDLLPPGKDIFVDLHKAAMAKWHATLTHSELVGWIRSQPQHPDRGTPLLSRDTSPESLADALIQQGYFLATTDG